MKKLTSAIISALLVLTAIVTVFAVPAAAAETVYVPTAENLGTVFVPVKKNPFVTDKLDLTEGTLDTSKVWSGFPMEAEYYNCGGGVIMYSPSLSCLYGIPTGTANVGVTFKAPKAGKISIKVTARKENNNGTEVRIGIGINGKHYGENDVTEPLTTENTEKTFTYTVEKDDVIAIIVALPNAGDGGNALFTPEITYAEEPATDPSVDNDNPSTADFIAASAIVAVISCGVVVKKKKH